VTVAVHLSPPLRSDSSSQACWHFGRSPRGSGATQEELAEHHDGPVDASALLSDHIAVYRLDGALFFGAVPRFLEQFRAGEGCTGRHPPFEGTDLHRRFGADALAKIIGDLRGGGSRSLSKVARTEHEPILTTAGVVADLDARGHLFDDLDAAIAHARYHVDRQGTLDEIGPHSGGAWCAIDSAAYAISRAMSTLRRQKRFSIDWRRDSSRLVP